MNRKLVPWCLTVCLLNGQPAPDTTVIKVTTRLLQVSVLVHDRKGDPVSNLTKDDFVLYDKGQPQKILYFSKESSADSLQDSPHLDEGVVSNRYVAVEVDGQTKLRPLPNSVTAILLDTLNTRFGDQALAKQAIVRFLKQIQPGDRVAIYTLTNSLRVLHDFTTNTSSLMDAVDRFANQDSAALAASAYVDAHTGKAELDQAIDTANGIGAARSVSQRASATFLALRALANHLAGLPGRKNLIWISGEFPIGAGAIPVASQAAEGLAIYPVDARGIPGIFDWSPSFHAGTSAKMAVAPRPMDGRAEDDINASHAAMNLLADRTGGRACLGNEISTCIHRAVNDARITYTLYYTPSHNDWKGEFRDIKIKLNRPGLEARYRKGYYAFPDVATDVKARQEVLADAGLSPLPATGLAMVARILDKPQSNAVISLVIEGSGLSFADHNGSQEATLDLRMLVFSDDQPTPLSVSGRTVHLALKPDEYALMLRGGVRVRLNVPVTPKSLRIRVVARDAATGRVGSLDVPLA